MQRHKVLSFYIVMFFKDDSFFDFLSCKENEKCNMAAPQNILVLTLYQLQRFSLLTC